MRVFYTGFFTVNEYSVRGICRHKPYGILLYHVKYSKIKSLRDDEIPFLHVNLCHTCYANANCKVYIIMRSEG